jgi:FkbM family methyltransferase
MNTIKTGKILDCLPSFYSLHSRDTDLYDIMDAVAKESIAQTNLSDSLEGKIDLGVYGELKFPFYKMGAINTLDLFGLDELMIFSFYWVNRNRYQKAADIGANLGLHSILMARCGWTVESFEPDPIHVDLLKRNLQLNDITSVHVNEMAVSDKEDVLEFIRVKGNTTGSHLAGSKESPYGELDKFSVKVAPIKGIMTTSDFIKMDVEGHEAHIILSTKREDWNETDMILEVGTVQNAKIIFEHLSQLGVSCFSQKHGWSKVSSLEEMPKSYKEGSLFISTKTSMPWS